MKIRLYLTTLLPWIVESISRNSETGNLRRKRTRFGPIGGSEFLESSVHKNLRNLMIPVIDTASNKEDASQYYYYYYYDDTFQTGEGNMVTEEATTSEITTNTATTKEATTTKTHSSLFNDDYYNYDDDDDDSTPTNGVDSTGPTENTTSGNFERLEHDEYNNYYDTTVQETEDDIFSTHSGPLEILDTPKVTDTAQPLTVESTEAAVKKETLNAGVSSETGTTGKFTREYYYEYNNYYGVDEDGTETMGSNSTMFNRFYNEEYDNYYQENDNNTSSTQHEREFVVDIPSKATFIELNRTDTVSAPSNFHQALRDAPDLMNMSLLNRPSSYEIANDGIVIDDDLIYQKAPRLHTNYNIEMSTQRHTNE